MSNRLDQIQNWPERAQVAKWRAATLAKNCGVSVRTLHRHFLKNFGKNTRSWLDEQRQQNARELLCDSSSIKETAACLGYKQQTNFTRHYKKQTGLCPSQQSSASLFNPNSETSCEGCEASEGTPGNVPSSHLRNKKPVQNQKCPKMINIVRK